MINELKELFWQMPDKCQRSKIGKILFDKETDLFEYCAFAKDNPCIEICIRQDNVHAVFDIDGYEIKMGLDERDVASVPHTILAEGRYEKEEFDMVMSIMPYLNENAVIFDVGANLGWYGININKRYSSYQIHFFEPVPETYERLLTNLKLNDLKTCISNRLGLSKWTKEERFYYDVTASVASSMVDLRELDSTKQIVVSMMKLDEYARQKNIQQLDFIKCDVEGAELFVYQGGKQTIQRYKPIVFSEMLRKWSAKFHYCPNDIIDFFNNLGYGCFVIEDGHLKCFGKVDEETLETNYFFLHKEKHEKIINELSIKGDKYEDALNNGK